MRPYLAVIRDSFHAALSSRVLWIAFVAIWLFLGALAPIGYHEDFTTKIRWIDFDNPTQLKAMLARGLVDPAEKETALGRLSAVMPDALKRQLRNVGKDEERVYTSALADGLNQAMENEDWYDAAAWRKTPRLKELRDLEEVPEDDLTDELRKRRSRLRIEAALPGVFESRSARSITLTYAGFDFPAFFAVGKEQFIEIANQFVMPLLMNWLLGFVLIFLGILVTSSIVPDMLQPGSLHLLLSKPISRTMLLISKFIGGCAFVLLCVCQLVIGLWLIAGLRLDIWNIRLLWCIPVAVFLFSVFFSVSVFAGLRWRSPILAIGVTCIFGAFVLVIGVVGSYFDNLVRRPARIRSLVMADATPVAVTRGGELMRYDRGINEWEKLIEIDPSRRRDLILPPVQFGKGHILTARIRGGRFNPYGTGAPDLLMMTKESDWMPEPSLRLPIATRRLFPVADNNLLAMNTGGLMIAKRSVLDQEMDQETKDADVDTPKTGGLVDQVKSLMRMQGLSASDFKSILPPGVAIIQPARGLVFDNGKSFVIYTHGRLLHLRMDSADPLEPWSIIAERELEGDASKPVILAGSGSLVLVMRPDEKWLLLDRQTLETKNESEEIQTDQMLAATGLGDQERFVAVNVQGTCVMIENGSQQENWRNLSEVETVHWDNVSGSLLAAHDIDCVTVLTGKDLQPKEVLKPTARKWRFVDQFIVTPLRTITPQTGELGETVAGLVGGKSAIAIDQNQEEGDIIRRQMLRPILSCSVFIFFMMTLSCVYFSRKDF